MERRAYVYSARWPFRDLSVLGQMSWIATGGGSMHIGLYLPGCTPDEVARHSGNRTVSLPDADGASDVCFDIQYSRRPQFHTTDDTDYFGEDGLYTLYPVLGISPAAIHAVCCRVAAAAPVSTVRSRFSAMTGGVVPCTPATTDAPVGDGQCGGLTIRILAAALSGSDVPLRDDAAAQRILGLPRPSLSHPLAPRVLAGYSPRSALEVLLERTPRVLGALEHGFEGAAASRPERARLLLPPLHALRASLV